jgi:hypothetical protein
VVGTLSSEATGTYCLWSCNSSVLGNLRYCLGARELSARSRRSFSQDTP